MKITTNELRQIIKEAWRSAGLETIPTAIQTKFPKALKDFEIVLPYEFNRDGTTKGQFTTTNEPLVGAREIFKQKPGLAKEPDPESMVPTPWHRDLC